MKHEEWSELKRKMAEEVIAMDFCELYFPYQESIEKAKTILAERNQKALEVEHRMGQALIAIEKLGYRVEKING